MAKRHLRFYLAVINSYTFERRDRESRKNGGGVLIYSILRVIGSHRNQVILTRLSEIMVSARITGVN